MYKIISISCSPEGQPLPHILKAIEEIKINHPEATLFHTFTMDLEFEKEKGNSVEIQEKIKDLFPKQEEWVDGISKPLRKSLAKAMARHGDDAKAYFLGELKGEAFEEYQLFANAGVKNTEVVALTG